MNTVRKREQIMVVQIVSDLELAELCFDAGDSVTAKWAVGRARDAVTQLLPKQQEKRERRPRARAKPRQRRRAVASSPNGSRSSRSRRTPLAKRRSEVLELLHREGGPLTATEISKKLGVSGEVVRRTTRSIDQDLLDVVKGTGREPTRYALASVREPASA